MSISDLEAAIKIEAATKTLRQVLEDNAALRAELAAAKAEQVPREPTLLMENAGFRVPITGHHIPHRYFGAVWRAMYDAAIAGSKP